MQHAGMLHFPWPLSTYATHKLLPACFAFLTHGILQVHSDAIQAGLETIKKLLDGRSDPAGDIEDDDDDIFFDNLANDDELDLDEGYSHRAITT